jgi:hypothetical protein
MTQGANGSGLSWILFQGLLPMDTSRLVPDAIAGITLAALGIPEVMSYTKIIGTPVVTGLYTLFLPVLIFALFGSSRHLVVSADSATAAMVAAALTGLSFTTNTPRYVELTSLIATKADHFDSRQGLNAGLSRGSDVGLQRYHPTTRERLNFGCGGAQPSEFGVRLGCSLIYQFRQ